jgi:hypothetical protein
MSKEVKALGSIFISHKESWCQHIIDKVVMVGADLALSIFDHSSYFPNQKYLKFASTLTQP